MVILIAIDILALSEDNIFELTIHINKSFGLKIDAIVIQENRIACLNMHIYKVIESLFVQIANTTYIPLGCSRNRKTFIQDSQIVT